MLEMILVVICVINSKLLSASDIFHQNSKITFQPDDVSEYFGYAVVLSESGLTVGAPKAKSRINSTKISPGAVFTCKPANMEKTNVTCYSMGMGDDHDRSIRRIMTVKDFFQNDMWFGAAIATVPNGKLLVCAPRWSYPYGTRHILAYGACYIESKHRGMTLIPLKDNSRLAIKTDGQRREYGEYGQNLNFYAYGQAGMSVKVTQDNSIIIGAPGLMQWTGGIIDYRFATDPNSIFVDKRPVANPYFTKDLGPDDYFGYSVESGVFDVNGTVLFVAGAPRSKTYGQVLIFEKPVREMAALVVRAKLRGPQLGSYFGASLCCLDINNDGRSDLLVGAPNFAKKDDDLPYDQGAVFVYLTSEEGTTFALKEAGTVLGSGESGSRFGSAIADLGDVDDDGYRDVAIGAPWENGGTGVVYIYKGTSKGLRNNFVQKINAEGAVGFGISISKGYDVDNNNCSDLAIGAHVSSTAYLYRCIPTITAHAQIRVPDAMNLPQNTTKFAAIFCVMAPVAHKWPHVEIELSATITVDPEDNRASIAGDSEYKVTVKPGKDTCDEQQVEVKPTADLSKPIPIEFRIKPTNPTIDELPKFDKNAARLSDDSTFHSSFLIQLVRDCGEDLICTPWLVMIMEPFNSTYTPGTEDPLGVKITIINKEEPAYGAKVNITLPLPPKRVLDGCTLEDLLMKCDVPAPLNRGEYIEWEIELEEMEVFDTDILKFEAELKDNLYRRNVSDGKVKETYIAVVPKANFSISGKALPNVTIGITREKFYEGKNLSFAHYYEISNTGPSDWRQLNFSIELFENVTLSNTLTGCMQNNTILNCIWSVPAKVSLPLHLPFKLDLNKHGPHLEEIKTFNVTSKITLFLETSVTLNTTTTIILDPAPPIWPLVVGSIAGLLLLAAIIYVLYKRDFFSRTKRDELKRLQEDVGEELLENVEEEPSTSRQGDLDIHQKTINQETGMNDLSDQLLSDTDESTRGLICDGSD